MIYLIFFLLLSFSCNETDESEDGNTSDIGQAQESWIKKQEQLSQAEQQGNWNEIEKLKNEIEKLKQEFKHKEKKKKKEVEDAILKANNIFSKLKFYKNNTTKQYLINLVKHQATNEQKLYLSKRVLFQITLLEDKEKYKILEFLLKEGLNPNAFFTYCGDVLLTKIMMGGYKFVELILDYDFNLNALIYGKMCWTGPQHTINRLINVLTDKLEFNYSYEKRFHNNIIEFGDYVEKLFNKFLEKGLKINVLYGHFSRSTFLDRLFLASSRLDDKDAQSILLNRVCTFLKNKGAKKYLDLKLTSAQTKEIEAKIYGITTYLEKYNKEMIFYNNKPGFDAWYIKLNNSEDPVKMLPDKLEAKA